MVASGRDVGDTVTLPWIIAAAVVGVIAGPRIRASVFSCSTESGRPPRHACPACDQEILPDRWRWRALLPVTGRCLRCRARIGPYPLLAELAAGLALAVVAARAFSVWELAALSWLVLLAVPLAFIDVAVRRLPIRLPPLRSPGLSRCWPSPRSPATSPATWAGAAVGAVALAGFVGHPAWRPGPGGCQARRQHWHRAGLDQMAGAAPGNPHQPAAARAVHPPRHARGDRLVTAAYARSHRSSEDIARCPWARPVPSADRVPPAGLESGRQNPATSTVAAPGYGAR